jgi:hypothetical protein
MNAQKLNFSDRQKQDCTSGFPLHFIWDKDNRSASPGQHMNPKNSTPFSTLTRCRIPQGECRI